LRASSSSWTRRRPSPRGRTGFASATVRLAEGRFAEALELAEQTFQMHTFTGIGVQDVKLAFLHAVEAALALGNRAKAEELLAVVEEVPVGLQPPFIVALCHRFRARLAGEDPSADSRFTTAAAQLRSLELPFYLAVVQLEHGEWLTGKGRPDDARPLLADVREAFERLEATPWLDRIDALRSEAVAEVPA